jgi:hypothetical protein
MTGAPRLRGSHGTVARRYVVDGADGADSLGADGADALLADAELELLLLAGRRPWKPHALPFG